MINLLIDTCSWQNILTDRRSNKPLEYLFQLCESSQIQLFTHEKIIEEWSKNKIKEKQNLSKTVRTKHRHHKEINIDNEFPILVNEPSIGHIEDQIKLIDNLLSKATKLTTSDKIKILCIDKAANKKAPFFNKPDSNSFNDAYIIYSALEYFSETFEKFIFVSDNKTDFSDTSSETRKIHPDILEGHQVSIVDYYIEISHLINDVKNKFGLKNPISTTQLIPWKKNETLVDISKSRVEQLNEYLRLLFREFNYVPIHLLLKNFPFKTNQNSSYPYYSLFTMHIADDELYDIFKKITSVEDNSKVYKGDEIHHENAQFIRKSLSKNLVHYVDHKKSKSQPIELKVNENGECDCPKCSMKRLNFVNFFERINDFEEKPENLIEQAYLFHKIGYFIGAMNNLNKAYQRAIENKSLSHAFISKFNLSKLWPFIGSLWYGIPKGEEISKELKKIDLNSEALSCRTQVNQEIIKWIAEEKFYSDCRNKIQETKQKIVEQYHSSLNRGRASNNFVWTLINKYAECITLLESNNMIYDQFQEFYQLNKIFVEGLFASHAIENPYNSRLTSFSDWILRQLIFNGDSEHIIKTARRYNLKSLEYSNEDTVFSLKNLCVNFFEKTEFWHLYKKIQTHNVHFFEDYYNKIHSNLLVLLGLCSLNRSFINGLIPSILKFHATCDAIQWHKIKYFKYFIYKKKEVLTLKNLTLIFKAVLHTKKYHDEGLIETISDVIESRKKKILISQKDFNQIIKMSFGECPQCEKQHPSDTIIPILRVIKNENYALQIKEMIIDKLNQKFDFNLYYLTQIYNLMENHQNFFNMALQNCIPNEIKKRPQVFIFDETPIHRPLNHIINLCFKNDIDINREPFIKARSLSPYYNWLLDMDSFDYRKFEVSWITEYATKFYFKRMAACKQLKSALENFLKTEMDSQIERYYLSIYVRRFWEND